MDDGAWWWLAFTNPDERDKLLGVVIVEGPSWLEAIDNAEARGLRLPGDVQALAITSLREAGLTLDYTYTVLRDKEIRLLGFDPARAQVRLCPDCSVRPGEQHENGCDVTRCRGTGFQHLQCGGINDETHDGPCEPTTWSGEWPGDLECQEYGLWCKLNPKGKGWIPCEADDPDATEDLNALSRMALTGEARWDREQERWVRP